MTILELNGLVLRETGVGENDSYLDVLTDRAGRMSIYARGVRSYRSRNREATLPLSYSAFTVQIKSDDFTVMSEAQKIRAFGASSDLCVNAFSMYVVDALREFALPDQPQEDLLRLALNTLYAAADGKYPVARVKPAYELRLMSDEGYAPDLSGCGRCGCGVGDGACLDVMNGMLVCGDCLEKRRLEKGDSAGETGSAEILVPVSRAVAEAMRYVVHAPLNRLFAFKLENQAQAEFAVACEQFILNHLGHGFTSLDFFKQTEELERKAAAASDKRQ